MQFEISNEYEYAQHCKHAYPIRWCVIFIFYKYEPVKSQYVLCIWLHLVLMEGKMKLFGLFTCSTSPSRTRHRARRTRALSLSLSLSLSREPSAQRDCAHHSAEQWQHPAPDSQMETCWSWGPRFSGGFNTRSCCHQGWSDRGARFSISDGGASTCSLTEARDARENMHKCLWSRKWFPYTSSLWRSKLWNRHWSGRVRNG